MEEVNEGRKEIEKDEKEKMGFQRKTREATNHEGCRVPQEAAGHEHSLLQPRWGVVFLNEEI